MKFGRKINVSCVSDLVERDVKQTTVQNDLYNEWREYYLDYDSLKRVLKVSVGIHVGSRHGCAWTPLERANATIRHCWWML